MPERALLPESIADRERVLAMDDWVTRELVAAYFRNARYGDSDNKLAAAKNAWRFGSILHQTSPGGVPALARIIWPHVLMKAEFITLALQGLDLAESVHQMRERQAQTLIDMLEGGAFLGGFDYPTLADLSAYPLIRIPELMGFSGGVTAYRMKPLISEWLDRIEAVLAIEPPLIPRHFQKPHIVI